MLWLSRNWTYAIYGSCGGRARRVRLGVLVLGRVSNRLWWFSDGCLSKIPFVVGSKCP